jgi:hypothetical protein
MREGRGREAGGNEEGRHGEGSGAPDEGQKLATGDPAEREGGMNILPFTKTAHPVSLDDLFAEARSYWLVTLNTFDDGRYWARIKFGTIANTKLEADSPFVATPHEALTIAIESAKKVRGQFK